MNRITTAALLLGLAAGFGFAVAMQLVDIVRTVGQSQPFVIGVLATSVPIAAFGGALLAGPLAEIAGRRWAMIGAGVLLAGGGLLSALAGTVSDLAFGRVVLGAGIGLSWVAAPLMLSECARAEERGARITLFFVGWAAGILLLPVLELFVAYGSLWREAFYLTAAIAAGGVAASWFCPPSPAWLFLRGDHERARAVLLRLGWSQRQLAEKADKIAATVREGERLHLFSPLVRPVLVLTGSFMLLDQLTGSSNILFNQSLIRELSAIQNYLLVAGVNLVTTLLVLLLIDRIGRRFLFLLGLSATALAMLVMAAAIQFLPSPLLQGIVVALAVAAVTLTLGPIAVVLTCELMPLHVRTMAIPLILSLNFLFDVPVVFTYQIGTEALGAPMLFLFYGLATLAGLALLWRVVPETRGLSLEHIEKAIRSGRSLRALRGAVGPARVQELPAEPVLGDRR